MSNDGNDFHPASKWEEPFSGAHPMLTLYDLNRNPRPIKDPATRLTVSTKDLNSEFLCPICLGYIRRASLVMECLHRFCDECIQKCLRSGKKECPSCRIHIPTRRSLRRDEEFDLVLRHILGDMQVLEREEERQAQLAKSRSILFSKTRKRGMLYQQENTQQHKTGATSNKKVKEAEPEAEVEPAPTNEVPDPEPTALELETEFQMEPTTLIQILLVKHPRERQLERLRKNFITISGDASVHVLKVFLSRKLSHPNKDDIVILMNFEGDWVALEDSISIGDVQTDLCKYDILTLCYRLVQQPDR